jgi:hypothetical protein
MWPSVENIFDNIFLNAPYHRFCEYSFIWVSKTRFLLNKFSRNIKTEFRCYKPWSLSMKYSWANQRCRCEPATYWLDDRGTTAGVCVFLYTAFYNDCSCWVLTSQPPRGKPVISTRIDQSPHQSPRGSTNQQAAQVWGILECRMQC